MSEDDILKTILNKISETSENTRKELAEFRKETHTDFQDIRKHLSSMDVTQGKQQVALDDHIRRTELAEQAIANMDDRVTPLESHVAIWTSLGKIIAALGAISAIGTAIVKILLH